DGLRVDPVAADPLHEHLARNLPRPEPRDPYALGEVARRMLDGVMDLARGHLDRQPDAVALEPLELGLHRRGIESGTTRLPRGCIARWRGWTSTTRSAPAGRTRPTSRSLSTGRRSRPCSSSRASPRTTTSPSRGGSA